MKVVKEKKDQLQKQIEFYFSNSNLPFDKFLKEQCASDGGWVDLSVVVAFSRVQNLLGSTWTQPDAIPDDCIQAVATILRELESIEISEDGYQIRRKDMPESWDEIIEEVASRTVHVACLPQTATLERLVHRFSDFGTVNQVRLLKHVSERPEHRVFRGCCLIELGTEEEAKAVLATPVEYEDCLVRVQTKAQYDEAVKKETEDKSRRNVPVDVERPELVADGLPDDPVQGNDEEPHDEEAKADLVEKNVDDTAGDKNDEEKVKNNEEKVNGKAAAKEPAPFEMQESMKGRLLRFTLEEGDLETIPTGRSLKDSFPEDSGVMFVDQGRDEKRGGGFVKMKEKEQLAELLETCDEGLLSITTGHKLKLEEMKGEEEVEWWKQDAIAFAAKKAAGGAQKRKSFGDGRGGRGRGRCRGRGAKRGRT